jgi:1-phosphatidylinositol-5-phosphate 4-kinase
LYNLGIVDILTNYGMKKKSAHVAKTKLSGSDADGISTVRPEIYARRFLEFIDKHFT